MIVFGGGGTVLNNKQGIYDSDFGFVTKRLFEYPLTKDQYYYVLTDLYNTDRQPDSQTADMSICLVADTRC